MKILNLILVCLFFSFTSTVSLASNGITTKESCYNVFVENANTNQIVVIENITTQKISPDLFLISNLSLFNDKQNLILDSKTILSRHNLKYLFKDKLCYSFKNSINISYNILFRNQYLTNVNFFKNYRQKTKLHQLKFPLIN